jgi:hypothetical protein
LSQSKTLKTDKHERAIKRRGKRNQKLTGIYVDTGSRDVDASRKERWMSLAPLVRRFLRIWTPWPLSSTEQFPAHLQGNDG